jgi:hypothetical protein
MRQVEVNCAPAAAGWLCKVTVIEGDTRTDHDVSVSRAELDWFAEDSTDPTELVRASIDYLLEREPKEAILRRFALSDIGRYFPAYSTEIRARKRS